MAAKEKFSIAISKENLKSIEDIAVVEERSRNWIINKAIELYLENNKSKEGKK